MPHPWDSAWEEFQDILPLLREHGVVIGEAAKAGDPAALEILGQYKLLHRSFDPVTFLLLKGSLQKFLDAVASSKTERG